VLARSLSSRNKSDCQTDYKLRNFGNRNYLHAITKIQLNSVGVKISKMKSIKNFKEKNIVTSMTTVIGGKKERTTNCGSGHDLKWTDSEGIEHTKTNCDLNPFNND
jgi:hypothetical protein